MTKKLPPLVALEAFEAAARFGSFTKAAEHRHMTHSGVSRHVQTLEHWCGQVLFDRNGPKIALNEAGRALFQRVSDPLEQLYQALQTPRRRSDLIPLHVLVLPSLASSWLMPRLPGFIAQHPNIAVSLHAGYDIASIPPFGTTVALRYGTFTRDGLVSERLFDERMLPVASPSWLAAFGNDPARWPGRMLLRHAQVAWPQRLRNTVTGRSTRLAVASGVEINDAMLLLQAVSQNMGVVWARERLAHAVIAQTPGQASIALMREWSEHSERAYWLAHRAELSENEAVRVFKAWILSEADREPALDGIAA